MVFWIFVKQKKILLYSGNAIAFIRNSEGSIGYSVYKKTLVIHKI